MKWSWRIATVAGIGIYIHVTFLLLLAFIVFEELAGGGNWLNVATAIGFIAAMFTIVVLHELGHALAAKRYGIKTQDITLLPIGGVARLERIPEEPKQELVVALAGPAVNVVLALLCALILGILINFTMPLDLLLSGRFWASLLSGRVHVSSMSAASSFLLHMLLQLLIVNVVMVGFNLLPAFPMDGGRVLRALLAMTTDYPRATRIAAGVGRIMAVLFVIVALKSGLMMLMFIALFVWIGGGAEAAQVESRSMMGGVTARQAMVTNFQTIAPTDSLQDVSLHVVRGFQQDFPVVDGGQVVGMLTRNDLLKGLAQHNRDAPVADVMHRTFERAEVGDPLQKVFERLKNCACRSLPVLDQGRLVGVIDMENVGEFIALRSALGSRISRQA